MRILGIIVCAASLLTLAACQGTDTIVLNTASTTALPFEAQPLTFTVSGQNLKLGARVFFDDFEMPNVQVNEAEQFVQITTLKNPALCGPFSITVKNIDGGTGTRDDLLSYFTRSVSYQIPASVPAPSTGKGVPVAGHWVSPMQTDVLLLVPSTTTAETAVWLVEKAGTLEQKLTPWPAIPLRLDKNNVAVLPAGIDGWNGLAALTTDQAMGMDFKGVSFWTFSPESHAFSLKQTYSSLNPLLALAVGDWDQDGDSDAMVLEDEPMPAQVVLTQLTAQGTALVATSPMIMGSVVWAKEHRLLATDLEPDGRVDVLYYKSGTTEIRRLRNDGHSTVQWVDDFVATTPMPVEVDGLVPGDATGDGKPDLLVLTNDKATVRWLLQREGLVFEANTGHVGLPQASAAVVSDFTQDRRLDVLLWSDMTRTFGLLKSQCPSL